MTKKEHFHFGILDGHNRSVAQQRRQDRLHLYSSQFTLDYVEKLARDERSGIMTESEMRTISMHCRFIGREEDGFRDAIQRELFKYSAKHRGIIVAFANSSILSGSAPSPEHDLRWIFLKVQTTLYYFKPDTGSILRGTINNRTSPSFIGCLIHTIFNADVQIDESDQSIYGHLGIGDEIEFEVISAFYTRDTVTIRGKLVGAVSDHSINLDIEGETIDETAEPRDMVGDDEHDSNISSGTYHGAPNEGDEMVAPLHGATCLSGPDVVPMPDLVDVIPPQTTSDPAPEKPIIDAAAIPNDDRLQYAGDNSRFAIKKPVDLDGSGGGVNQKAKKKKERKAGKERDDYKDHNTPGTDSAVDQTHREKKKKKRKDKSLAECRDAIPELVLEKKLKRESEGSSNNEEKVAAADILNVFDDDDDFEPAIKKKKKK